MSELLPQRNRKRLYGALTPFSRRELRRLLQELQGSTREQRRDMPGMKGKKVDAIVPGTIMLLELMRFLGVEHIAACKTGLREGLVAAYLRTYSEIVPSESSGSSSEGGFGHDRRMRQPDAVVRDGHVPVAMRPRCTMPHHAPQEGDSGSV